ncbi:hypothetical protein ACVK1X_003012 [Pseudomonas sp. PvR086]|nr:hypothetical protein [Pseudomonas frederiksbergensis]
MKDTTAAQPNAAFGSCYGSAHATAFVAAGAACVRLRSSRKSSQPTRIPQRIIMNTYHQSRPNRIGNDISGKTFHVLLFPNRSIVIALLPQTPASP